MSRRFHQTGRNWFASPDQGRAPDGSRYEPMLFDRPLSLWGRAARDAALALPVVAGLVVAFLAMGPK